MKSIFLVSLALMLPQLGFAHAHLKAAIPAQNAVLDLKSQPNEVKLTFSEAIEPAMSKIEVHFGNKAGANIASGSLSSPEGEASTLRIKLSDSLKAGKYIVLWKVVSKDTHKMQGEYAFTLRSSE